LQIAATVPQGEARMPVHIPPKAQRKTVVAAEVDWLSLGSLSIGGGAALMAAISYFGAGDPIGAAFAFFGGAGLMSVILFGSARPPLDE
jgi:hypothetical protein